MFIERIVSDKENIWIMTNPRINEENKSDLEVFLADPNILKPETGKMRRVEGVNVQKGKIVFPRFQNGVDEICSSFSVRLKNESYSTLRFVEEVHGSLTNDPYPILNTKKGLQTTDFVGAKALGIKHTALNVNQGDFMLVSPEKDNTIIFEYNGESFFFRKDMVESLDKIVQGFSQDGVNINLTLLNAKKWSIQVPEDVWSIIKHPACTGISKFSAFNIETADGLKYFKAFIAFIANRYTQPNYAHGRIVGLIVGNEIDSQKTWYDCGQMTVGEFARHYLRVLRIVWQIATNYASATRIYSSFDHFWTISASRETGRYFAPKEILTLLGEYSDEEGQFPWGLTTHPYPEDLLYPDFWNDQNALDEDDAAIVSFNNLEVLIRFLHQSSMLYKGNLRYFILSEQGFNSWGTVTSEILQAMAFGKAYKKVMQFPEIESFILHAHTDSEGDGCGSCFGILRAKDFPTDPDDPKPIYYVLKEIDQIDEKHDYHWKRY